MYRPLAGLNIVLFTFSILLSGSVQTGEIYRWTDDRGNIHFGDKPPPGEGEPVEIDLHSTGSSSNKSMELSERRAKQQKLLDIYQEERLERARERQREAALREERKNNCTKARSLLHSYRHAPSLYRELPDGSREILSKEERQQVTADAYRATEVWCR